VPRLRYCYVTVLGLCVVTTSMPAHADQWQDISQRKQLICGTFADVPPFAAPDPRTREMVGFDVDLCKSRAQQIQFSDSYYVAKEMLAVKASNPATEPGDFKGKRISAAKGSTSELSITLNGSDPVTFQDTGSAYMALQQNKSVGMVANTMTITNLVEQSKTSGSPLKMIAQPMLLEPVAIGMKQGEPVLLEKVNEALLAMDKAGEIDAIWSRWLGPDTRYKLTRDEHVQPISSIKFTPIP
jgi:polar amino acid transport system substrate-binding protein